MKKFKLVLVEWEDSASGNTGWQQVSSAHTELTKCVSVGFMTHKTKEVIVLFPHLDGDKNNPYGQGAMTIPRSAVVSIKKLKF